ncbi:MAG TPA: archaeal heat shock protein Hsp20 [Methanomassiliicoccales archaeon]|jgi:HSP20 family protein
MAKTERKRTDDINDNFSNFDEEFEEMRARMDRIMEQMLTGEFGLGGETKMYGVSMRMGPDGQPHIQEFGNVKPIAPEKVKEISPIEPLVDVLQEKDKVRVIIELPGVQKDDIGAKADGLWLEVSVDTENRKFSKRIELPCPVRSGTEAVSYRNGVLDITLDREPPKRRKKKTIVE